MLPISQEYIGSVCEIKNLENDLYSTVRIIKIDHDALELSMPEGERMMLLQYRVPVKLYVRNGHLGDQILIGITYLSTENFLRIEEVRELTDFERRGAFRVNSGVVGTISRLLTEDGQSDFAEKLEKLEKQSDIDYLMQENFIKVEVIDISLTGVRLISKKPLHIGEKYTIEFKPLKEMLVFSMKVTRVIHSSRRKDQFGCTFFDMKSKQLDYLCRDLFQLQRIEKNRRSNSMF